MLKEPRSVLKNKMFKLRWTPDPYFFFVSRPIFLKNLYKAHSFSYIVSFFKQTETKKREKIKKYIKNTKNNMTIYFIKCFYDWFLYLFDYKIHVIFVLILFCFVFIYGFLEFLNFFPIYLLMFLCFILFSFILNVILCHIFISYSFLIFSF